MKRWLVWFCLGWGSAAMATPLQLCVGDGSPWAPYTHFQRSEDGRPILDTLAGSAVEQIQTALTQAGLDYHVDFMPWARVMHELALVSGFCDLAWNASYSPQRAEFALFSDSQYRTQLGLFLIPINAGRPDPDWSLSQRYCGVNGYNYQPYDIDLGRMVMADSVQQALMMLEAQRCQFFPSEIEPIYGGADIGLYRLPDNLAHVGTGQYKAFHALVSRRHPEAQAIIEILNNHFQAQPLANN